MHPSQSSAGRLPIGATTAKYGQGTVSISAEEIMRLDPDALTLRLVELFRSPRYQPPVLPAAATQIMKLSTDPNVEARDLVEVLGTDPLLMGRVTATAQSPLYSGGAGSVRTLQDAVRRLGIRGLRNIVLEAAMSMRVFRTPAYVECMETIRRHSLVVAHFSTLVARAVRLDPNEAFLAGLMHDVGLAGGLLVLADGRRREDAPSLSRFWSSVEQSHTVGGAAMARFWGLPEEIVGATLAHHEPHEVSGFKPMAGCVCMADHLAQLVGARIQYDASGGQGTRHYDADVTDPAQCFRVRDAFRISPERTQALLEAAKELYPLIG